MVFAVAGTKSLLGPAFGGGGTLGGAMGGVFSFTVIAMVLKIEAWQKRAATTREEASAMSAQRAQRQASTLLDWSTAWLPPKIVDEVVGNAFEHMEKMHEEGVSHWRIQAYALRRILWCYVYTLRDVGVLAIVWRFLGG